MIASYCQKRVQYSSRESFVLGKARSSQGISSAVEESYAYGLVQSLGDRQPTIVAGINDDHHWRTLIGIGTYQSV